MGVCLSSPHAFQSNICLRPNASKQSIARSIIIKQSSAISYAAPMLPVIFLCGPIGVLQGIYAKYFNVPLSMIASVLLIARLFDAITDPAIGYYADRYYAKGGSRKLFVAIGCGLLIVSCGFLYMPVDNIGKGYLLTFFLMFYLAFTLFEIPHLAWAGDLAENNNDKNLLYSYRAIGSMLGGFIFYAIPLLPIFETKEITPEIMKWAFLIASIMMIPALHICISVTPDSHNSSVNKKLYSDESTSLAYHSIVANKPLLIFLLACFFTIFGSGMSNILLFIFVDTYLGMGEQFALAYMVSFAFGLGFVKLAYHIAPHWGNQNTWIVGIIIMSIGILGIALLKPTSDPKMLLYWMVLAIGGGAIMLVMIPPLLSNIVDYGTWKFGRERSATYFSLFTLLNKSVGACAGALALGIAGWFGFDPSMTDHNELSVHGLLLGFIWLPLLMFSVAVGFVLSIPINVEQHRVIRNRLDARVKK